METIEDKIGMLLGEVAPAVPSIDRAAEQQKKRIAALKKKHQDDAEYDRQVSDKEQEQRNKEAKVIKREGEKLRRMKKMRAKK